MSQGSNWRTWLVGALFAVCMTLVGLVVSANTREIGDVRSRVDDAIKELGSVDRAQAELRGSYYTEVQAIHRELREIKELIRASSLDK